VEGGCGGRLGLALVAQFLDQLQDVESADRRQARIDDSEVNGVAFDEFDRLLAAGGLERFDTHGGEKVVQGVVPRLTREGFVLFVGQKKIETSITSHRGHGRANAKGVPADE